MEQFKFKNKLFFSVVVAALIVGGAAGAIAGFYAGTLSVSNFNFLNNPLAAKSTSPVAKSTDLQEQNSIIAAVKKASPAVVSVVVSKNVPQYYSNGPNFSPNDFFNLNFPFGFQFQIPNLNPTPSPNSNNQAPTQKQEVGGGSGFVISSAEGLILTNKHVVADTQADYTVVTNDGQKLPAKVVARDPFNDIAVLKVDKKGLPEVILGDSDQLQIGQTVIAIGNALGQYRNTVTRGIVSGIGRNVVAGDASGASESLENIIQTDAAINPGNSGGPLINLAGQVIGINSAINQSGQLIGFSIPINQAKKDIGNVKQYGKIVQAYLGVRYVLINDAIAKTNNLSVNYGALIVRGQNQGELAIVPGSPANKAGLLENDIILEINGKKINEANTLAKQIQNFKPGNVISLKVLSKGQDKTIKVTLEEYKQ
jgi:serine protease Do